MQFVYPNFLWALVFLAIPVIIHLFNFRRYKKLVFSNISLIKAATEVNKKQEQIKKWLILISRLLALFFLVLAFAQPFIPVGLNTKKFTEKVVAVYLDNSFSMNAESENGILIEVAKNNARKIAEIHGNKAQYMLLTNNFEGKHQHLLTRESFLQMVDEIKTGSYSKSFSEVCSRQNQLLEKLVNVSKDYYFISDFQYNFYNKAFVYKDTAANYYLIPLKPNKYSNLAIDTAYIKTPFIQKNKPINIAAVIKNYSLAETAENIPVTLKVNQIKKAIQNITVEPNKRGEVNFNITLTDTVKTELEIGITDYPIAFDDNYFLSVKPSSVANILLINNNNNNYAAVKKVFMLDAFYNLLVQDINQLNYAVLNQTDLVILNQPDDISSGLSTELNRYVSNGGILLIIPGDNIEKLNTFTQEKCGLKYGSAINQLLTFKTININDPLFKNVFSSLPDNTDMPTIKKTYEVNQTKTGNTNSIITLNNGMPYLYKTQLNKGIVYTMAGNLSVNQSNLNNHALFVPLMLNMPLQKKYHYVTNYLINNIELIEIKNSYKQPVVNIKNNNFSYTALTQLRGGNWYAIVQNPFTEAGFYNILSNNITDDKIAINYNRDESNLTFVQPEKKQQTETISENLDTHELAIKQNESGKQLWIYMLLGALLFLTAEIMIIKLLK